MNSCIFYFHNKFIRIDSFICLKKKPYKAQYEKNQYTESYLFTIKYVPRKLDYRNTFVTFDKNRIE